MLSDGPSPPTDRVTRSVSTCHIPALRRSVPAAAQRVRWLPAGGLIHGEATATVKIAEAAGQMPAVYDR